MRARRLSRGGSRPLTFLLLMVLMVTLLSDKVMFRLDTSSSRVILEGVESDGDMTVTSGGALIADGVAVSTLTGQTKPSDPWSIYRGPDRFRVLYPQMIMRTVTPKWSESWDNYTVHFEVQPTKNLVSESPEVQGTDGIYVLLHYKDQDNLYVGGLSKDGRMYIKRKAIVHGNAYYALMAEEQVFRGEYALNDNLITPFEGSQITFDARIQNGEFGSVNVLLRVEIVKDGKQVFLHELSGEDSGNLVAQGGSGTKMGPPNLSGRAGLRLDSIEGKILEFIVVP